MRELSVKLILLLAVYAMAIPAAAVTVKIDYTYDTSNFFGGGNPQSAIAGERARAALDAAAGFFTDILDDSFSAISVPPQFNSSVSDGMVTWQWTRNFSNPSTGNQVSLTHSTPGETLAADDYVVFAGARNLNSTGIAGPGGFGWSSNASGSFSLVEISQITSITNTFQSQVERRGETSGFARWGGSIAFDTLPPSPWHFDHAIPPPAGAIDFYSVALHELAHALGFGASNEWDQFVTGLHFYGPSAQASYGAPVPLADAGHWANSTTSTVYGGTASQQTLMSTSLPNGTRGYFTQLDAAGMMDIGWSVVASPVIPEPSTGVLLLAGFPVAAALWRRPSLSKGIRAGFR